MPLSQRSCELFISKVEKNEGEKAISIINDNFFEVYVAFFKEFWTALKPALLLRFLKKLFSFILAINYASTEITLSPIYLDLIQISKNTYLYIFFFLLTFQLQLLVCGGFCGITWWSSPTSRRSGHRRYLHWKSESSSCTPRIGSNFFQWKSCVSIVQGVS